MQPMEPSSRAKAQWLDLRDRPAKYTWPGWAPFAGGVGCVAYVATAGYAVMSGDPRMLGATLVVPGSVIVTAIIANSRATRDRDPFVVPLIMGSLAVKLLGAGIRYWTAYSVYEGG